MPDYESLNHTTWDCKYHIVWIPKYRKKKLYEKIRIDLSGEIRRLAECRESKIVEGAHDERPRAHSDKDTAKILGVAGSGIYKRKKRDLLRQGVE